MEGELGNTRSFYRESTIVVVHNGVTLEIAATKKLTVDDIQDAMISKSQQLSNNKTGSSVPKHTADIAAMLILFL